MGLNQEIVNILLPLIIVSGIVIFVVFRMVDKAKKGTLGKKETKESQSLLNSMIPFGMLAGLVVVQLFSLFTEIPLAYATLGPGLGLLAGYIAYEIYSRY